MGDHFHVLVRSTPGTGHHLQEGWSNDPASNLSINDLPGRPENEARWSHLKELTKLFQGEFWIEYAQGKGTFYHFCFPKDFSEPTSMDVIPEEADDNLNSDYNVLERIAHSEVIEKRMDLGSADTAWLEEVNALFLKNLANAHCKIDWVAYAIHLSERQFNRRLKQITGMTPGQYLREMRMQKAMEFLSEGKYSTVKEVSISVGFMDTAHFSKLFQERFGTLPSTYLK
jgi:AraC-like DNA-binding protein